MSSNTETNGIETHSAFWLMNFEWVLEDPSITPDMVHALPRGFIFHEVTGGKIRIWDQENLDRLDIKTKPDCFSGRTVIYFGLKEGN